MYEAKALTLRKDQIINHWQQEARAPGSSDLLTTYSNVTIQDCTPSGDREMLPDVLLDGTDDASGPLLHQLNSLTNFFLANWSKILPNLFLGPVEGTPSSEPAAMIVNIHPPTNRKQVELRDGEVRYPNALNSEGKPKIGAEEIGDMSVTIPVVKAIVACLLSNKPVWVHCSSGKDRSPIIVTLALMVLYNASAEDAYRFVEIERPIVGTRAPHQRAYWNIITDFEQNTLSHLQSEIANWRDSPPDHSQLIQEAQAAAAEAQASIDAREQSRPSAPPEQPGPIRQNQTPLMAAGETGLGDLALNNEDPSYAAPSGFESADQTTNPYSSPVGEGNEPTSGPSPKLGSTRNWCATLSLAVPGAVLITLSGLASTLAVRAAQSTELAPVPFIFKLSDFFNGQSQVAAFCYTPLGCVAIGVCALVGAAMLYAAYQQTSPSQGSERSQELL
jgi:hypothetical protein